ncbi:Integrase zinc binding domain [Popillia japonica]|uniref:RNA-directed DNA polymerase n=1 Tax=Popillia japonica TaxID=7064 RepID=A0AAW1JEW1_POPJA
MNNIPVLTASRLQRWAVELSAYQYDLVYRKANELAHADALSRLPNKSLVEESVCSFSNYYEMPLNSYDIAEHTKRDKVLNKAMELTKRGWTSKNSDEAFKRGWTSKNSDEALKPYFPKRSELSVENDCLFWGNRIVVPYDLRNDILELMHDQHIGVVRMKLLARNEVWWPNIDNDIEGYTKRCEPCQLNQKASVPVPYTPWSKTNKNWKRVHIDFFHYMSNTFLIIVDSHSKFLDIHLMNGTNAKNTIGKLRSTFSYFGLPEELVSDNGPPFNGEEYKKFCKSNGITHRFSPPLHPCSNGLAERAVGTVKSTLKKQLYENFQKKLKREQ